MARNSLLNRPVSRRQLLGTGPTSPSSRTECGKPMPISASAKAWRASSAPTRTAGWRSSTVAATTELDGGDNPVYATDFRRVYASVIEGWLGHSETGELLNGTFEPFPMFA